MKISNIIIKRLIKKAYANLVGKTITNDDICISINCPGTLIIDGVNCEDFSEDEIRENFPWLDINKCGDFYIKGATIMEQIDYGNEIEYTLFFKGHTIITYCNTGFTYDNVK